MPRPDEQAPFYRHSRPSLMATLAAAARRPAVDTSCRGLTCAGSSILRLGALAISIVCSGTPLDAQSGRTVIHGYVVDSLGRTIDGAQISTLGTTQVAVSDTSGRFQLRLASGRYLLRVRRIGFAPTTVDLAAETDTIDLSVTLAATPYALPEVMVAAAEQRFASKLAGFAERMRTSAAPRSAFITRGDIERRNPARLTDLLPRSDLRCAGRPPTLWLDGMILAQGTSLDAFAVHDVEALEIYRGAAHIPSQYNMTLPAGAAAGCVIFIWTR